MKKFLETVGIRARIVSGFAMLVALLALIAFLYDAQLRTIRIQVDSVAQAADAAEAIANFDRDVLDTRRLITRYFSAPTATEQLVVRDAQNKVAKRLDEVKHLTGGSADDIAARLARYRQVFDLLVTQIKNRQSAYSTILATGMTAGNTLNALTAAMVHDGELDATVAARLQEDVQAYVDFATRYFARGSGADADNAAAELERAGLEFTTLKGLAVTDAWMKARIAGLEKPLTDLAAAHGKLIDTTKEVAITSADLNGIGQQIGESAEALKAKYIASRNQSVENARSTVASVLWTGIAVSAGAVVLGIAVAIIISAGIVAMVRRIIATMQRLAGGDLTTEVPDTGRTDDIGAMARAVEVFKQNGLRAKHLEAEADEQRNLTEEERRRNAELEHSRAQAMAQATQGLAEGLTNLAKGNLSFELRQPFAADFESLRNDFNAAVGQLRETLSAVALATGAISGGSNDISQSADDLSRRTEQQAASLEQTAAALDEITVNVKNASMRVDEARTIAAEANNSARQAGGVVANAVDAMQKISASSAEISNIIGVIDEIAFQTNLLALNAGVEAARAGEAGKGFAVVAQEVRELAQRSARAAKEIKGLIINSTTHVEGGVKLVSDTGAALKAIEAHIVDINEHMSAISISAREQSTGLSEVNTAINQMDQVTQQNAAMVGQTSAAGSKLATEAGRLREMIDRFQLEPGGHYASQGRSFSPAAVDPARPPLARPAKSPARQMVGKLASAFSGGKPAPAAHWEEF